MKKLLTIAAASSLIFIGAKAAPITPEGALQRLASSGPAKMASLNSLKLRKTVMTEADKAGAYIFTRENGRGFTILSADDAIAPVIGYSDTGVIDADNLPPALIWWIGECAAKAETLQQRGSKEKVVKALEGLTAIAPLCKTQWNQDAPYNNSCPTVEGVTAPTGCVATSMAQAMKYFNYPEVGIGSISYVDRYSMTKRTMDFSRTKFAWDNMLDVYEKGKYDTDQARAVATLMKAAGFSVEMTYRPQASGATSSKIQTALVNYFGYDESLYYAERNLFSSDEWTRMIYDNIKNCGPVIYDGTAYAGGHSFICDGYDGNGYFHFNWGWGGMSDGYYVLDSLRPESQGIGGAGEGGFNWGQGAVLGMRKPEAGSSMGEGRLKIYGTVTASVVGNVLKYNLTGKENVNGYMMTGLGSASFRRVSVNIGASFEKVDGSDGALMTVQGKLVFDNGAHDLVDIVSGNSEMFNDTAHPVFTLPSDLPDGRYKVTLVTRSSGVEEAAWLPVYATWGNVNYCYLTVADGKATAENATAPQLKFDEVTFASPLYLGHSSRLKCIFRNDSDSQITLCYYPALSREGKVQYMGDYMLVTVNPGETLEKLAMINFEGIGNETGSGTYTLSLFDLNSGSLIGDFGEYEMGIVSGSLKVTLDSFSVPGAPQETITIGTRIFQDAYIVKDASDVEVLLKYIVESGYLDTKVRMILARYDAETNKFVNAEEDLYSEIPYIGGGDKGEADVRVDMSSMDLNTVYRVNAGYVKAGKTQALGTLYIAFNGSGVDDIEIDDVEALYYNMQGMRVDAPSKGQMLIRKTGRKSEKVIY